MTLELWKGNEAIAEAAVRAGLEAYFGYPITPQTELLEYLSKRIPELGRAFVQAESEVAAINMLFGAACAGARGMTSTSSPGFSLMQEGLSYIAASKVPCVVVDMMRGGPGLGNILPTQGDYFQLTKGGGHGDYHPIVLAPASVQEAVDLTYGAFDLAEKYRSIVIIAADGNVGQMMEPVEMPPMLALEHADKGWELSGAVNRPHRVIESIRLEAEELNALNAEIHGKEMLIIANEARWEETQTGDADVLVVAFGTAARIAQSAIREARSRSIRAGLFRPITLWPFPIERLAALTRRIPQLLVVEMNAGQMLEDVRLANDGRAAIEFFGRTGGLVPMPDEILERIESVTPRKRVVGEWATKDSLDITQAINDCYEAAWGPLPSPI